jgi:hypothetical protein
MKDFILFMYNDCVDRAMANDDEKWNSYFSTLRASGRFDGGSSIGSGTKYRKNHPDLPSERGMNGFIRIRAEGDVEASSFLAVNPVYEAGGTVEIRELPREDQEP